MYQKQHITKVLSFKRLQQEISSACEKQCKAKNVFQVKEIKLYLKNIFSEERYIFILFKILQITL